MENHSLIAMIARAFLKQNPYIVWGDGRQVRNWTHVDDIVKGMILAAEKIDDGSAINLGTSERVRVIEAAQQILNYTHHAAKIETHPEMPTGPLNRVADNNLAYHLLGWEPQIKFKTGLKRTIDWYFSTKKKSEVEKYLPHLLNGR